jgi:hypothetical protein
MKTGNLNVIQVSSPIRCINAILGVFTIRVWKDAAIYFGINSEKAFNTI